MKRPPGNLLWLSLFWIAASIAAIVMSIKAGTYAITLLSAIALLLSVGLWYQSNLARYMLMGIFSLTVLTALLLFAIKGLETRYLLRALVNAYFVYELATAPQQSAETEAG